MIIRHVIGCYFIHGPGRRYRMNSGSRRATWRAVHRLHPMAWSFVFSASRADASGM